MTPEQVRLLFDYNAWANHRVLDSCAPLTVEQFTRPLGSSFSSVRDTLVHIVGTEWVWLERWRGRSPDATEIAQRFRSENFPELESVRGFSAVVEREMLDFAGGLSEEDLLRTITYRNTRGTPFEDVQWQMLQHLVNHGTYHRGQVVTLLRQLGTVPQPSDLIAFYRQRTGQPER